MDQWNIILTHHWFLCLLICKNLSFFRFECLQYFKTSQNFAFSECHCNAGRKTLWRLQTSLALTSAFYNFLWMCKWCFLPLQVTADGMLSPYVSFRRRNSWLLTKTLEGTKMDLLLVERDFSFLTWRIWCKHGLHSRWKKVLERKKEHREQCRSSRLMLTRMTCHMHP